MTDYQELLKRALDVLLGRSEEDDKAELFAEIELALGYGSVPIGNYNEIDYDQPPSGDRPLNDG